MGWTAIGRGAVPGLDGDENCAQCFELTWKDGFVPGQGTGAHPDIIGKRHIVQIINTGGDVSHSFDLQIPTAGRGLFLDGCARQYPGYDAGIFDCDNPFGGCDDLAQCDPLPDGLKDGCAWRYDMQDGAFIYGWRQDFGQTDNPLADFRRVQCPVELSSISGTYPLDDDAYPLPNLSVTEPPTFATPAPSVTM